MKRRILKNNEMCHQRIVLKKIKGKINFCQYISLLRRILIFLYPHLQFTVDVIYLERAMMQVSHE